MVSKDGRIIIGRPGATLKECLDKQIENGKNGLVCAFCGATKDKVQFVIGASSKPDWCMIYGTGKMACPDCYEKASKEGSEAIDRYVENHNRRCEIIRQAEQLNLNLGA